MNIPWELIFEWVSKLIEQCMAEGRPESEIRQVLAKPGGREWISLWLKMGREGVRGKERRSYMAAVRSAASNVTGDLIDDLIAEAKGSG